MVAAARRRRQRQTPAEAALWACLRDRRLGGLKFRRQHPLASRAYIADFFCYQAKLVIEIGGPVQEDQTPAEAIRQRGLESLGYHVLRFSADQIAGDLESVLTTILAAAYPPGVPLPDEEDSTRRRPAAFGSWCGVGIA
jgi:very-short-patch-repair endonuclease